MKTVAAIGGITAVLCTSIYLGYNHTIITLGVGLLAALGGFYAGYGKEGR